MKKSGTMKKMLIYYKPYMRVFWTDMFFATLSAAVALIIPLVVRYVTYNLVYREPGRNFASGSIHCHWTVCAGGG